MAQAFRCFFLRPLDRHPRQAPPRETMACHMDAVLQELAEHLDMPTLLSFGACGRAAHWLAMRAADDRARASFEGVCPLLGWGRPGPHWRRLGRSLKPRHRLHVRVTRRWSDLWCGHIGVPTWPNACRQQRVARSDLAPSALPPPKAARQRPLLPRGRSRVQPKAALLPPPRCGAERHPAAGGGPGHAGPVVRGVRADGGQGAQWHSVRGFAGCPCPADARAARVREGSAGPEPRGLGGVRGVVQPGVRQGVRQWPPGTENASVHSGLELETDWRLVYVMERPLEGGLND
ncbi:unnamed protein product [Prorocentrum cordatum]|uniref:Uncharacterized protein n=1 Tax=Prorocentrum cordatum TaxID=2364126 RepID=A0ABN9TN63_9DINO|nr:unnamed protein product [Polarella glacialis]